jgi:chromosome segregation ATPase
VQVSELERELNEARVLCAERLETIQRLENERKTLHEQIQELEYVKIHVDENVLAQQPLVRSAQQRILALETELHNLQIQLEQYRKDLADVHETHKLAESRRFEQEMNHIKKTLQTKLDALEFDVKRYHAERDEYRHKWELLHRISQQTSTPTQLQSLINSLQTQCNKLKEENATLKKELSQVKMELTQHTLKNEQSLQEALTAKTLECQELNECVKRQKKLISDLQQRLNSSTSQTSSTSPPPSPSPSPSPSLTSNTSLTSKLSVTPEKTEVHSNDEEVVSRSSVGVNNFDSEARITQLQLERQELQMKVNRLERLNRELQNKVETQKKEGENLIGEIETISKEFETIQSMNVRLAQQLLEKEDTNLQLVSERVKANHTQQALIKEKELLNDKINELRSQNQHTTELLDAQTRKITTLEEQIVHRVLISTISHELIFSLSSLFSLDYSQVVVLLRFSF